MASYAWILGIRPGYEDEYLKRHDEIWPEMTVDIDPSTEFPYLLPRVFHHS